MSTLDRTADLDRRADPVEGHAVPTAAAFWGAIVLPAIYLPLVVAAPVLSGAATAVPALLGLHLAALYVGRNHRAGGDPGGPTGPAVSRCSDRSR